MTAEPPRTATLPAHPAHADTVSQPPIAARGRTILTGLGRDALAVVPYVNYAAQRLGKLGIVGVALAVFSLVTLWSTNLPLREQLAAGNASLEQVAAGPQAANSPAATPQVQLERFLDELPTRDDLPGMLNKVVAASSATGIQLDEGRYELAPAGQTGHIARYRLSFPVTGSYPQVRGFIEQALVAVPSMSLDGMTLERSEIADQVVTAELDFAVFVRTGL